MGNKEILVLNAALYIGTFILYQIKVKKFTLGSFVLLFYATLATLAVNLFFRTDAVFYYADRTLTVFPFIYLYVVLMMMFTPLLRFSETKITNHVKSRQNIIIALSVLLIVFSVLFLIFRMNDLIFDGDALAMIYREVRAEARYREIGFGFSNFIGFSYTMLQSFAWLLLMYNLLYIRKKGLIYGLILAIIVRILYDISIGGRMATFNVLLDVPFLYFVFREQMSKKIKKILLVIIIGVVGLGIFGSYIITMSRFSDRLNPLVAVQDYMAQSFINFNTFGLDAGGTRQGEQTATLIKIIMGADVARNSIERREKFWYLNVDNRIFYSFVGEFTIDFGPTMAFLIFVFAAMIFLKTLSAKSYHFGHILILLLLYQITVQGFSLYTFGNVGGNLQILLYIALFMIFNTKKEIVWRAKPARE